MPVHFAEINGAACRYAVTGAGPMVVLIHELGGSLDSWDALLPLLPGGLRVLRYDLRGAGLSEKHRGTLDLDQLADDVAALLDHLGERAPVTLLGAAAGAAVAVRFAGRHATRLERLAFVCPSFGLSPARRAAARAVCDALEEGGMRAIADATWPVVFPEPLWADATLRARARARWLGADPFGYAAMFRALIAADLAADLAAIACPVLALAGAHDPLNPPDVVREALRGVARGRVEVIAAGHFAAVQSPALLRDPLARFLTVA